MIYKYIRFSGETQDEESQQNLINTYCKNKGIRIDETIMDCAISGASDLGKRDLLNLLGKLEEGDTLVISELSRLTRKGTVELNNIISNYFQPAKVRLIICNYGLDIDCANIDAMTELILNMMATFARIERDSIIARTIGGVKATMSKGTKVGRANEMYGKVKERTDGRSYEQCKEEGIVKRREKFVRSKLGGVHFNTICEAVETIVPEIIESQISDIQYPRLGYGRFRKLTRREWEQICRVIISKELSAGKRLINRIDYDYKYIRSEFASVWQNRFKTIASEFFNY